MLLLIENNFLLDRIALCADDQDRVVCNGGVDNDVLVIVADEDGESWVHPVLANVVQVGEVDVFNLVQQEDCLVWI